MTAGEEPLAEQFEEALEWDWDNDEEVVVPYCDLENQEVCEACD